MTKIGTKKERRNARLDLCETMKKIKLDDFDLRTVVSCLCHARDNYPAEKRNEGDSLLLSLIDTHDHLRPGKRKTIPLKSHVFTQQIFIEPLPHGNHRTVKRQKTDMAPALGSLMPGGGRWRLGGKDSKWCPSCLGENGMPRKFCPQIGCSMGGCLHHFCKAERAERRS